MTDPDVTARVLYRLWHGQSLTAVSLQEGVSRRAVRSLATAAGIDLVVRRGQWVARQGIGWCAVLVNGRVYERAKRLPDGTVSLITSGRQAGQQVVPWSAVECYAPLVRYNQRTTGSRWCRNPLATPHACAPQNAPPSQRTHR